MNDAHEFLKGKIREKWFGGHNGCPTEASNRGFNG